MESVEALYSHVTMLVVGVVLSLSAIMLFARSRGVSKSYREARHYMAAVYALIALDLVLSLLAHAKDLRGGYDALVDVLCYTPVAVCFALTCSVLLDDDAVYRKKIKRDVVMCPLSIAVGACGVLIGEAHHLVFVVLICAWALFIMTLGINILRSYTRALVRLDNIYSADKIRGISWLRNSFVLFVLWGLCSPVAAVCPILINTIYTSIGGAIYVYVGVSMINYSAVCRGRIDLDDDYMSAPSVTHNKEELSQALRKWREAKSFKTPGIMVNSVAQSLNMTQFDVLAAIANEHYSDFTNFIMHLRVREAQELLVKHPKEGVLVIAQSVGYISLDDFNHDFHDIAGVTPQEWREGCLRFL